MADRYVVSSSREMRNILLDKGFEAKHVDDIVGTKTTYGMLHDLAKKDCEVILIGETPEEDIVFANKEVVDAMKNSKKKYNWRHDRDAKLSRMMSQRYKK